MMKPAFETERLRVFKLDLEGIDCDGDEIWTTFYLAYESGDAYAHHVAIECTTWRDDNCVVWIELRHAGERKGFALELLNGICEHMKFKHPMEANNLNHKSKGLFAKHEEWFRSRASK